MARKTYKGAGSILPQTESGAYKYPVPVHVVDSAGFRRVPPRNVLDSPVSAFALNSSDVANMNVNGSVTTVEFSVTPPSSEVWIARSMHLYFQGSGITVGNYCGRVALTNGCTLKIMRGVTERLDVFGEPIKTTGQYLRYWPAPEVDTDIGGADHFQMLVDIEAVYGGLWELDGKLGDKLVYKINDDLTTGLQVQTLHLYGWKEVSV